MTCSDMGGNSMPKIAAFVLVSTLSFVVPTSAADEGNSQWRPMWDVVHMSGATRQVPLGLWVDEPSTIATQNGVTREMVERVVQLFLRRNGIPSEPETNEPYWIPHIHVAVSALKIEYDSRSGCEPQIVFKIDFALRNAEIIESSLPRWGNDGAYAYRDYWTHGMLGFAGVERFPSNVRAYLSEAIDQFSLNFLKARDEVSADLERWLHSID